MLWYALLVVAEVVGFLLIPLGLPGLWVMLAAAVAYKLLVAGAGFGWLAIVAGAALSTVAEVLEFTLSARYTRRYGGSRRAGWGALGGGIVGAIVGVPVPVIGSVIGAFVGSFAGALVAEYSLGRSHQVAGRSAWGALVGRVAATATKTAIGVAVAIVLLVGAFPG